MMWIQVQRAGGGHLVSDNEGYLAKRDVNCYDHLHYYVIQVRKPQVLTEVTLFLPRVDRSLPCACLGWEGAFQE